MLNSVSKEFKKRFLKEFTKELIRNHGGDSLIELKTRLKKEQEAKLKKERQEKDKIKKLISEIDKNHKETKKESLNKEHITELKKELNQQTKINQPTPKFSRQRVLTIPKPKLPQHLSYLKPTPTNEKQLDLGKLNPLIKDPKVRTIECHGPGQATVVSGRMGEKPTKITLDEYEINEIIQKFSKEARLPIEEGIFRAAVGKLEISAIISETTGNKFIITKIGYHPEKMRI